MGFPAFTGTKSEEHIAQLLEMAATLGYPGTITKNVLKSRKSTLPGAVQLRFNG